MTLTLRPYQEEALEALEDYFRDGKGTAPIIVAATGAGKSLMISEMCKRVCASNKNVKIICITHSRELVAQNSAELKGHWREASVGIYSAGLNKRQTKPQIIFCSIQSVYKKAFSFGHVDIIFLDEAHMLSCNAETMYGRFFSDIKLSSPNFVLVGLTATPYRMSDGILTEGEGALFDGIAYVCEIRRLIEEGYLVPVISKGGLDRAKIDLTNVHIRAGDYSPSELAHASDSGELVKLAVEEIVSCGKDRKSWLIFATGVLHAEHVSAEIRKHGITSEVVTGETRKTERDRIISDFKSGKLRSVVNVGVMTTGVNIPCCDLIALMTSTQSTGKFVQMAGRGLRTHPGKKDCLLLDYGGNCERHGLLDDIDPIRTRNIFNIVKNSEPTKECPQCKLIIHSRLMACPACDFEFAVNASHGVEAFSGALLKNQQEAFVVEVKDAWISRHKKAGKPDSVKVAFYDAEEKEYALWLALDHEGYAREKALGVVKQFGGSATTVETALKESSNWNKVSHIQVRPDGRFFRVEGFVFKKAEPKQTTFSGEEESFKYY